MSKEIERTLRRQILFLESENEALKRKLQLAEELNWKAYKENQKLNLYVRAFEDIRTHESERDESDIE